MGYDKYSNCTKFGRTTSDGRKVFIHDWEIFPTYWKCKWCGSSKTVKPRTYSAPPPPPPSRKKCSQCPRDFETWEELFKHKKEVHERPSGWDQARKTAYNANYGYSGSSKFDDDFWSRMFGGRNRGPEAPKYPDSSKPVQIQIMEFIQSLAKTQSLGFSDGEWLTMINIALKKAGVRT